MNTFNNLKIGTKIIAGYVIALVLMVVVGGVALVRLGEVDNIVTDLTTHLAVDRQLGNDMVTQVLLARFYANKYIASHDSTNLDRYQEEAAQFDALIKQANTEITKAERVQLLKQVEGDWGAYQTAFNDVTQIIASRERIQTEVLDVQGPLGEEKFDALRERLNQGTNTGPIFDVGTARGGFFLMRLNAFKYLNEGDSQIIQEFDADYRTAQTALAKLDRALTDSTERRLLTEITTALDKYAEGFHNLKADYERQHSLQADQLDVLGPNVRQVASNIVASVGADFEAQTTASATLVVQTRVVLIVTMIAAALLGLGLGVIISRGITRPLQQVSAISQQIAETDLSTLVQELGALAQGDLTRTVTIQAQPLTINSRDEVGQMALAFNTIIQRLQETGEAFREMSGRLREAVGQVAENAASLNAASGQLAAAANQAGQATNQIAVTVQQVAKGTAQQTEGVTKTAASVEQVSRAIDGVAKGAQEQAAAVSRASTITAQITDAIKQVSANAQTVTQDAQGAAHTARSGAQTVQDTVRGMESIRAKVNASALKVKEMGQRSDQIGAIVETIDDIASQTNLLALNAAIEAARAGEHGKGFAVVADEVRKLAERASVATKEIAGLIKSIQQSVTEAVVAMDEGAKEVQTGVAKADAAGEALTSILKAVEAVNQQAEAALGAAQRMNTASAELVNAMDAVSAVVEENTAATEEMAAGASEVTRAIENIASVSEENSASVEEVSASAEEMNAQVEEVSASAQSLTEMAQALQEVVARFQLETAGANGARPSKPTSPARSVAPPLYHPTSPTRVSLGHGNGNGNGHKVIA